MAAATAGSGTRKGGNWSLDFLGSGFLCLWGKGLGILEMRLMVDDGMIFYLRALAFFEPPYGFLDELH